MSTAHYILQVNIYLIVFYGFYKLLLDKETYFTLNRIYLLSAGLLSLAIPFLRLEWFTKQPAAEPVYVGVEQVNTFMTQVITAPATPEEHFGTGNIIVALYALGVLFFAGKLVWQLSAVSLLLKQGRAGTAFSFFNRKRVDAGLPQVQTINRHEEVHMRQLHSLDIIFFELLGLFTWFNPVIYGYKRAVKNIHEYLADEAAAAFQGDKKEYALLLLSNAFGVPSNTLTNSFFNKSLIKKRIFMLHKQRSKKTVFLKYGLFLPLFAITLLLSSATIRNNQKIQEIADEIPLNNPVEVVKEVVNEAILPEVKKITAAKVKTTRARVTGVEVSPEPEIVGNRNDPSWEAFYRYMKMYTRYPSEARQNNVQGNTIIHFKVNDGAIEDLGVAKKLGGGCDAEAMRVILGFSDYKSIKNGNYAIRFIFYLSDGEGTTTNMDKVSVKGYTSLNDIVIAGYKPTRTAGNNGVYDASRVFDFVSIDKQPTFPGGMQNFYAYLKKEVKYPEVAKANKIQGKVFLSFIVEKDGSLTDIKVERKLGGGTDEEAVRVIKASPKWIPGSNYGQPVRVKYNIPISFSLGEKVVVPTQQKTGNLQLRRPGNGISFRDEKGNLISLNGTGSANPLYVVDGTPVSGNYMSSMVPDNIESVTILKDAAASALYGAKAANGVILITTKTGKPLNLKEVVVTGSEKE